MKLFSRTVFLVACLAVATVAQAQNSRSWVSGVGDDVNPCSRTAPCKTFAGAISKTAPNGEIDALDPGGFGGVTITKTITLSGPPGYASILVAGTPGITVNGAGISVTLRNIMIQGMTTGTNGINVVNAAALHLHNVFIEGFSSNCVNFNSSATAFLLISDSKFTRCVGGGVLVNGSGAATLHASIVRSVSDGNLFGYKALGLAHVDIADSEAGANGEGGFLADGVNAKLFAINSRAHVNGFGLKSSNNADLKFFNGSIAHNLSGPTQSVAGGLIDTTGSVIIP